MTRNRVATPQRLQSFRDDYSFRNSDAAIRRFPFPLVNDTYRYTVNLEPHVAGDKGSVTEHQIDIDEHYVSEMHERAVVLASDPLRYQTCPEMRTAEWEVLELVMTSLAKDYPEHFSLERRGNQWHWRNHLLAVSDHFDFDDDETLPGGPLSYIGRQCQGDFCLLSQRDGQLWLDAGLLTAPSDWSLDFNVGMNFFEFHRPVPMAGETRVFERAHAFLLRLEAGKPMRRLNWGMTVRPRLDTAPETYPDWGRERQQVTAETIGHHGHLRVELQALWRLPRSQAIAFSIRTYLLSLEDLARDQGRALRLHQVLSSLAPEVVAYKGLSELKDLVLGYLAARMSG